MKKKKCSKCKKNRNLDKFCKDLQKNSKISSWCKFCRVENTLKWELNNKKYTKHYKKTYYTKNNNSYRERNLMDKYGINLKTYNFLLKKCNFRCEICKIHKNLAIKKLLVVDHCHKNGYIRGLLCTKCNVAIGNVKENIKTLKNMIIYLRKAKKYGDKIVQR